MSDLPTRKKNRIYSYDYSQNGAYFITICTKNKKCNLSNVTRNLDESNVGACITSPPEIHLSPREFSILLYLIRHQGMIVSRQQILDNIYSIDQDLNSNVIDVYIRLLRKKIDANTDNKLIHTIRGSGYILKSTK